MRTELTKRERSPYAIWSLSPFVIGGDAGVWPIAGAAAPKVKPPAHAGPLFRKSLRAGRFEPMDLSLSDEPTWDSLRLAGRKYTPGSRLPASRRGRSLIYDTHNRDPWTNPPTLIDWPEKNAAARQPGCD